MRGLLAFAALIAVACHTDSGSVGAALKQSQTWLRQERFGLVLSRVDDSIRLADRSNDLRAKWRFRLIKAEALLGQESSFDQVLTLLTSLGYVPGGEEWAADRAQWLILRVRTDHLLNQDRDAAALLAEAARAASQANRPDLAAEVEFRRGNLLRYHHHSDEAERVYRDLIATARQLHDRYLEARIENTVGVLLIDESRYDEAISELEHARFLALEVGTADTAARAAGNLGLCYYRLGDYDNASALFEGALYEFSRNGNQYETEIWIGYAGSLFLERRDFRAAMSAYQRALAVAIQANAKVFEARWLSNLAQTSVELGNWNEAEEYNNRAIALKRELKDLAYEANSLNNAGRIAAGRGDPDRAKTLFAMALKAHSEDPTVALQAHAGLAAVSWSRGRSQDADTEFRNAIAAIDRQQAKLSKDDFRLSWLDSLITFYQKYVDFLMAEKQPDRALEAAESSRAKVLTSQPIPQLTASGYRQLARQTGSVLLEYWLGPNQSYLWAITPERVVCHNLPAKSEILPLIRSYRAVVTGGRNPLDVAGDTGLKLYNTLLAPAVADAGAATRFIIVPDDELYSLNFETLPDGNNSNRFWIDRATVRISPSLNYLASNAPRTRRGAAPKLLLIGDPVSSLPQYPHLEFASQEISAIASAMFSAQPTRIEGAAATPDAYAGSQPGNFGFIHFSAHAAAAAKRASALDSAVILSGPPDKCRLVARAVLAVPLNAELVTVSACRSAGGKTYGGEGLVGFAWAFMKAGAGNVIAGLWDVNDRSTVQLMTGLYTQIAAGVPAAEALRSSKLALIHGGGSYAKPFYWAPFELYTARAH